MPRTIQYITKEQALEILGWHTTPKAGTEKLMLLRRNGLLSKPQQAPRMYVRKEVESVHERFGADLFIHRPRNSNVYELVIQKAA